VAGDGPDQKDRRDGVEQRQQQAAVEGERGPQRCRRPQAEGVRKQAAGSHAFVAKEPLDAGKKPVQPDGIDAGDGPALGQAPPESKVSVPLVVVRRQGTRRQHAGVSSVEKRKPQAERGTGDRQKMPKGRV